MRSRDADYRFRVFVDRDLVATRIADAVRAIDYGNFKNSVQEKWTSRPLRAILE